MMAVYRFAALTPSINVWNGPLEAKLPSLSIVISTNKRDSKLPLTLASLAAVDGIDIEVLVFDDTPSQDLAIPDSVVPRVRIVRRDTQRSRGLGYARSKLLSLVEGEVVVVMDDDFIVDGVVLKDLSEVHQRVDGPVIAGAPLYMVRDEFAKHLSPAAIYELVRSGELQRLAAAYLVDSHYTVPDYGKVLNSESSQSQTLLAGHSSFVSFKSDLPGILGINYLPIRRAEDSAFGDAALTRGAGLVWCQGGLALHVGLTEMGRLRENPDEFSQYETWRRAVSFGWLPTSGRPNNLTNRGLDRTWARPSVAICLFVESLDRTNFSQLLSDLSRWDIRDWIVCIADAESADMDSASVLEQFSLDENRNIRPDQFDDARWDATWQLFCRPTSFENVIDLIAPLVERPVNELHASSGWSSEHGCIVRSHDLARERLLGVFPRSHRIASGHLEDGSTSTVPSARDLKSLQSERVDITRLVSWPETLLMMDTAVTLVSNYPVGQNDLNTSRVTAVTRTQDLHQVPATQRRQVSALMRRGVLITRQEPHGPLVGLVGSDEVLLSTDDYLQWRINQKRQLLDFESSATVDAVSFGILMVTKRPEMWVNIVANLERQVHQPSGVLVVCHGWTPNQEQIAALHDVGLPTTTVSNAGASMAFGEVMGRAFDCYEHGDWVVKMDDDDVYGALFLRELATHITLNPALAFLGLHAEFVESVRPNGRVLIQRPIGWQRVSGRYQAGCPAGGTMCFASQLLSEMRLMDREAVSGIDVLIGESLERSGAGSLVLDGLNYVLRRYSSDTHGHTWQAGEEDPLRSWTFGEYSHFLKFLESG